MQEDKETRTYRRSLKAVIAAFAIAAAGAAAWFAAPHVKHLPGKVAARWHAPATADFGQEPAGNDVHRMANWIVTSHDNAAKSFAILDKAGAKVFLFDPGGHLQAAAPAVLGAAHGDDTVPGIGDKPLKDITMEERTTPAGRFVASVGESASRGEDVVWVDYDAAVSMHRIIKVPERLQAIATPQPDDNRLSYGCINLPDEFYEKALRPAVDRTGVIVYILPETRPLEQTFASFHDADSPRKVAQH